jgi:hypothetical protein
MADLKTNPMDTTAVFAALSHAKDRAIAEIDRSYDEAVREVRTRFETNEMLSEKNVSLSVLIADSVIARVEDVRVLDDVQHGPQENFEAKIGLLYNNRMDFRAHLEPGRYRAFLFVVPLP